MNTHFITYSLFEAVNFFSNNQPMENLCNWAQRYSLQSLEPHTHTKSRKQHSLSPSSPDSLPADSCFPAEINICSWKSVPGLYPGVRHLFPQSSAPLTMIWYFQKIKAWYSSKKKSAWPVKLALLAGFCDCSAFLCWLAQDFQQEGLSQRCSGYKAGQSGRGTGACVQGPESRREKTGRRDFTQEQSSLDRYLASHTGPHFIFSTSTEASVPPPRHVC